MFRRLFVRPLRKACSKSSRLKIETLEGREVPAAFAAGNLVVFRVGDGSAALSNASTASFLDEYTPGGSLVQSVPLPVAVSGANQALTTSGSASSEGFITRSGDGNYLVVAGYASVPGVASIASSTTPGVLRVIGRIAANGSIDTTTTTTNYSANNIRSATTSNGSDFWSVGANTGVVYQTLGSSGVGTIVSTNSVNNRVVSVIDGQLYVSSGSGTSTFKGVNTVGTGMPTSTGQTIARLPGLTDTTNPTTYSYYLADLSPAVAGTDTLYVADDGAGGLTKFSLVSGSWVKNNTVGSATDLFRGLTGATVGNTVNLFATRTANQVVSLVDTSGYNTNMPTSTTLVVSAGTNTAFRGIAFTPVNVAPLNTVPSGFTATEDTSAVLSGLSVGDGDVRLASVKVTLQVANGTLTVNSSVTNGIASGQITSGNGTNTVVINAPIVNINATLANASGVTYAPTANFSGNDTFTLKTEDLGNTGSGPVQSDTDNVTLAVAAVADDPSVTDASTAEDTQTSTGLVFTRNAADGSEVAFAKIIAIPTHGTLFNSSTALAVGDFISYADAHANLKYTPAQDYSGTDTFQIQASTTNTNAGLGGAIRTATITIDAVNDAPVNSVPPTQTQDEDVGIIFGTGNLFTISDVDAGTAEMKITLTISHGTVTLNNAGTITGNGTASIVATGTIAELNTALDSLYFAPEANFNGAATIEIVTDDQGNTGGAAQTATDTVTINLDAVNDTPVNSVPSTQSGTEDTTLVFSSGNGNLISIVDVDAGTATVKVTLSSTHGKLLLSGTTNLTVTGDGTALVNATGKIDDLNAAIAGLKFLPDANYNGAAVVQINTNDLGNTGSGTALADTDSVTINLAAVNNAPVNTLPATFTTDEDSLVTLAGVSVSDVDAGTSDVTVTFSIPASTGNLRITGGITGGVSSAQVTGNNSATVSVTAPMAEINATLADSIGLIYFPALDFNGSVNLGMTTNDNGNSGAGIALTDTDSATINVVAINDVPFNVVPGDQVAEEGTPLTFTPANGNPITVGDVDAGTGLMMTVSALHGTISLNAFGGLIVFGNGTASASATGTVAQLNGALNGMTYTPDAGYTGSDTIKVAMDDQGNTGFGGPQTYFQVIHVDVTAVNNPPVNTVPSFILANEDTPFAFTGASAVSINDVDAGNGIMSVVVSVNNGTLTLATGGSASITNNGTASVSASGTKDDLNAALAGMTYTSVLNYSGADTFTIVTDDGGNTGGAPESDTDTTTMFVQSVNDAPVFEKDPYTFFPTGTPAVDDVIGTVKANDGEGNLISYAIASGDPTGNFKIDSSGVIQINSTVGLLGSYTLTVTATDNDPFGPATGSTTVLISRNSAPTNITIPTQTVPEDSGTFTLALPPFFNDGEQSAATLVYTASVTANPSLLTGAPVIQGTDLKLTPALDANGSATILVRATDGGNLFVETSFTFTVTSVNDAPAIASIGTVNLLEDPGEYTVNLTGLSTGPANESTQTLTITASSSDTSIIPNPTVQYTGGATGTLKFTPVANAYGSATITVTVKDNGGGTTDTTLTTFVVNVTSVNDGPVIDTDFTPMLPPIAMPQPKNAVIPGTPIGKLLEHVTDPEGDPIGIAITSYDGTRGQWQYSTDTGTTWTNFPVIPVDKAFLLTDDGLTQVRFVPNKASKGVKAFTKGFADLTFRGWDHTDGATPVTLVDVSNSAYTAKDEFAWVAVGKTAPMVDADGHPVLKADPIAKPTKTAKPSAAFTVKKFLGLLAKEVILDKALSPTTVFGIAVSDATGAGAATDGAWQFNTGKGGWQPIGTVSDLGALLLRPTDRVRYVPGPTYNGNAELTYHTWDLAGGTFGQKVPITVTDFSADVETAIINAAPILTPPHPTLPSVQAGLTTAPVLVSTLLGTSATDIEQTKFGMYVSAPKGGTWEYSLNGTTWTKVTKAVYLPSTAQLKFTAAPKAKVGAIGSLTFKAWDQTINLPATLSTAKDKITVTVIA